MLEALRKQLPSVPVTYALDRCSDKSSNIISSWSIPFVVNKFGEGHQAGRTRNAGLDMIRPNSSVLMLDGDRVPVGLSVELLREARDRYALATIRIGDGDQREKYFGENFTDNPFIGVGAIGEHGDNGIYTCGLLVRSDFIKNVRIVQGALFHSYFHGRYGSEDVYLGYLAEAFGYPVGMFPKSVYLQGISFSPNHRRVTDYNIPVRHFLRDQLRKVPTCTDRKEFALACTQDQHLVGSGFIPIPISQDVRSRYQHFIEGGTCPQYCEEKMFSPTLEPIPTNALHMHPSWKKVLKRNPGVDSGFTRPRSVAFYTPMYEKNNPSMTWGVNTMRRIRELYPQDDLYFTLNSKYDPSVRTYLTEELGAVEIPSRIVGHGASLDAAMKYLHQKTYEIMIHIEQDVIINGDIKTALLSELKDRSKIMVYPRTSEGNSRIDISTFAIRLGQDVPSMISFVECDWGEKHSPVWMAVDAWDLYDEWWKSNPNALPTLRRTQDYALACTDLAKRKQDLVDRTTKLFQDSDDSNDLENRREALCSVVHDFEFKIGSYTWNDILEEVYNTTLDESALYWGWIFDTGRLACLKLTREGKAVSIPVEHLCKHAWESRFRTYEEYMGTGKG